jgi:hypothetical protein
VKIVSYIAIVFLLLSACTNEDPNQVLIYSLLHDDSSKVWIVDSEQINNQEYTEEDLYEKKALIFYEDRTYQEIKLKEIGSAKPTLGEFEVTHQNKAIRFRLNKQTQEFILITYSKSKIELLLPSESRIFTLIPLPRLKEQ